MNAGNKIFSSSVAIFYKNHNLFPIQRHSLLTDVFRLTDSGVDWPDRLADRRLPTGLSILFYYLTRIRFLVNLYVQVRNVNKVCNDYT